MASVPGGAVARPTFGGSARVAAFAVAVVFLVVGVLGFIPGITTNYAAMTFAGDHSGAMLFGVFAVSVLHNLVHLAFGVVGVGMASRRALARGYLIVGGVIYLVLWAYGLVVDESSVANFVPLNDADDWLHLVLGMGMVLLGSYSGQRTRSAAGEGR